jgi:hypothetical protein
MVGLSETFASNATVCAHTSQVSIGKNAKKHGFFNLLSRKPPTHQSLCGGAGENLGFSTFFSTVVENFGGRPYRRAGDRKGGETVAHARDSRQPATAAAPHDRLTAFVALVTI